MLLEKLSGSLKNTLQKIASAVFVDDTLLNELIKDIQRALLQSDVNVQLVFKLTEEIRRRAKEEKQPKGLTKKEQLINIVYEELTKFLGGEAKKLEIIGKPAKIMLVGLFGSGKTTSSAKIALYYKKRGLKTAIIGLDVHRAAAMNQLEQLGKQINVPVFVNKEEKDAVKIYKQFEKEYNKYDLLVIDTAGRAALSEELISEIKKVSEVVKPNETLLVISADIGQAAQKQAQAFHDSCGVTGVIVTKMEGTAKGGGALSACAVTNSPIVFIGVGEKIDDLESFNPKGFVGRLLGMGDLEALLEKAKTAINEEEAQDLSNKLLKGEFNLVDLYQQMEAMKKMGSISKLVQMIPGFGQLKLPKEVLQVQEEKLKLWKYAMDSMTKKELEEPEIIDINRIERISKGSGVKITEVRELLKQYKQSKKLIKAMKGDIKNPEALMKKLGKKRIKIK